uniref:putative nuclease HARBI1 n=1 Tax=Pristiophorus japonicus TaxID=55135 RepID=UPI00398E494E
MEIIDNQCLRRHRFRKNILRELCNLLRPDLQPQARLRTALNVETKVTIAQNLLCNWLFPICNCRHLQHFSVLCHRSIRQVTDALYKKRLEYISFPMSREKKMEQQAGFVLIAGFPRVQGVIDCTHLALMAPQTHTEMFMNRKGFHSLNVQLLCDHQHKIMTVDARYPGSSHDIFILHQSSVPAVFSGPNQDCGWLLGDEGYPLCTWLLTPLRNPRTAAHNVDNDSHSGTRYIIEHCIGIFQQKFRCLDHSGGVLQYLPEQGSLFVVV